MAENMICKGNRVFSEQGRRNWDRIFGKPDRPDEKKDKADGR